MGAKNSQLTHPESKTGEEYGKESRAREYFELNPLGVVEFKNQIEAQYFLRNLAPVKGYISKVRNTPQPMTYMVTCSTSDISALHLKVAELRASGVMKQAGVK